MLMYIKKDCAFPPANPTPSYILHIIKKRVALDFLQELDSPGTMGHHGMSHLEQLDT